MAHYDCTDCGSGYGIAYGYCDDCTPASVLNLKKQLEDARDKAYRRFNKEISDIRDNYVKQETAELQKEYDAEYNKHKPKRR